MLSLLLTLLLAPASPAEPYRCRTEFGESVPLRKAVLKAGQRCSTCAAPGKPIPPKLLDAALSATWNEGVGNDSRWTTQAKRKQFQAGDRQIFLDTRYVTHPGPSFTLELDCEPGQKCRGKLAGLAPPYRLNASPVDQRLPAAGYAELTLGSREYLGLIVRIFKAAVPTPGERTIPISASGELKFYREDPLFVQDVGVDEQLYLLDDFSVRNAALELKIRCEPVAP